MVVMIWLARLLALLLHMRIQLLTRHLVKDRAHGRTRCRTHVNLALLEVSK